MTQEQPEAGIAQLTSSKIDKITPAFIKAQSEMEAPKLDKINPHFKTHYASLGEMYRVTKPALNAHGLSLTQPVDGHDVITRITHISGQWIQAVTPIKTTRGGSQDYGGGLTYSKRQGLCSLVAIAGEEDDDGESDRVQRGPARKNVKMRPKPKAAKKTPPNTKRPSSSAHAIADVLRAYALVETQEAMDEARKAVEAVWAEATPKEREQLQQANLDARDRIEERSSIQLEAAISSYEKNAAKAKRGDK